MRSMDVEIEASSHARGEILEAVPEDAPRGRAVWFSVAERSFPLLNLVEMLREPHL